MTVLRHFVCLFALAGAWSFGITRGAAPNESSTASTSAPTAGTNPTPSAAPAGRKDDGIEFNRDVIPILSNTCFKCHGPDSGARKANLRLDRREVAIKIGAIVPGKPDKSELVTRIFSDDPDEVMPPPAMHKELTSAEKETLKRWIAAGAEYQPHWSFIAPRRPKLPAVRSEAWIKNPIDRFILATLERSGLQPSPEANRATLIRRVTFDLTGLPPTPEEVEAFVANRSADAYEKLVDRLLASPRYGEHRAVEWLDAARYADTNGYQGDPTRTMWPWRDWVIEAFNRNMPFDEFTIEQIAGDLLPQATLSQRLASGFNRNHSYNSEGGRIPEETRVENVLDRVDTTSTAFLGLTLGCAKCHDHKFDPLTQKEYYQFYAYFNQCSEKGRNVRGNVAPLLRWATPEEEKKLQELRQAETAAEARLKAASPKTGTAKAGLASSALAAKWTVIKPYSAGPQSNATATRLDDGSVLLSGLSPDTDVYDVELRTDLTGLRGIRLEALGDPSLPSGGPGRAPENGNFVLNKLEAEAVSVADPQQTTQIAFAAAEATYSQGGFSAGSVVGLDSAHGWAVWHAPDKEHLAASFFFTQPVGFSGGTELRLVLHFESQNKQHTLGRFRLSVTTTPVVPPAVLAALAVPANRRTAQQKKQLRDFNRASASPELKALNEAVAAARNAADSFDKSLVNVMVMDDATPRATHVLQRGVYDKPGDKVEPGVPAALPPLPPLPPGATNNRLALARWLVDPANPLTARVAVNHYWQSFFGTGLVKTAEDFGAQGEMPSHPELLDWLAVQFRDGGWDVKAIQRLMVTSATYRQSSRVTPELLDRDPANRLLARGPRFRMTSFEIRDQALFASGLLVEKLGGPPVKPYQPPGVWEEMSFGQITYTPDSGEALYRRSLYTFWRRTVAPTSMFDVSARGVCLVRPLRTNTPLQALALLNDVTYIEAARVLSEKLLQDKQATDSQRLDRAFRLFVARTPDDSERAVLLGALDRLRAQYGADHEAAAKLLSLGDRPRDAKLDTVELASWTALLNTVMNLDEVITKE